VTSCDDVVSSHNLKHRRPRIARLSRALARVQQDCQQSLPDRSILAACKTAGYKWRERKLGPVATVHRRNEGGKGEATDLPWISVISNDLLFRIPFSGATAAVTWYSSGSGATSNLGVQGGLPDGWWIATISRFAVQVNGQHLVADLSVNCPARRRCRLPPGHDLEKIQGSGYRRDWGIKD
jgi:hypothetical protein